MGFIISPTSSTVAITGTVTSTEASNRIPSSATIRQYSSGTGGFAVTAAYQTLLTPTATKTFYLCGWICNVPAGSGVYVLSDNGTEKLTIGVGGFMTNVNMSHAPIPFATTVQIKGGGNSTGYISFWGYEV